MNTALRTDVCRVCTHVIYEVEYSDHPGTTVWLHDDAKRLWKGDILDVRHYSALFSPNDVAYVRDHLRRTDTNQSTGIFWSNGDGVRVNSAFCGHNHIAAVALDGARNPLSDCLNCGEPILIKRVKRNEVEVLHAQTHHPYCCATPLPSTLDSN
jgi:hypothetical protein